MSHVIKYNLAQVIDFTIFIGLYWRSTEVSRRLSENPIFRKTQNCILKSLINKELFLQNGHLGVRHTAPNERKKFKNQTLALNYI